MIRSVYINNVFRQDTFSRYSQTKADSESDSPLLSATSSSDAGDSLSKKVNPSEETSENIENRQNTRQFGSKSPNEALTEEEKKEVQELKERDAEVRNHEQAHIAAGGQYVRGGAHFEFQKGPDGKNYAIGGEVDIDISRVNGDPEATIEKMQVVHKAALAPANPSSKDRNVTAKSTQIEAEARRELAEKNAGEGSLSLLAAESYMQAASSTSKGNMLNVVV